MEDFYKPRRERTADYQYRTRLATILHTGELVKDTPQGSGALTCFGTLAPMAFPLENGVPVITERSCERFWRKPIAEIIAFINGAHTVEELEAYGCDFWNEYRDKEEKRTQTLGMGLQVGDLGPGSYGPSFHDFEKPGGGTLNQFAQLLEQLRDYPSIRTHVISPWKPYYTARGPERKVIVAPCHGWLHFRVIGGKLHMRMDQRSGDMPIGVPNNMIQYAALLLMICQVTGYPPGTYVHSFSDAHIYENQVEHVWELVAREPRPFPILRLNPEVKDLFAFRKEDFTLEEYDPHSSMRIPYLP